MDSSLQNSDSYNTKSEIMLTVNSHGSNSQDIDDAEWKHNYIVAWINSIQNIDYDEFESVESMSDNSSIVESERADNYQFEDHMPLRLSLKNEDFSRRIRTACNPVSKHCSSKYTSRRRRTDKLLSSVKLTLNDHNYNKDYLQSLKKFHELDVARKCISDKTTDELRICASKNTRLTRTEKILAAAIFK